MKKFMFFAALCAALCANAFETPNLFKFDADTIRVNPNERSIALDVTARLAIPCDGWYLHPVYSQGVVADSVTPLDGMTIRYFDAWQDIQDYQVPLRYSEECLWIDSYSQVVGYWDFDGEWLPYGTVKWAPGEYKMFRIYLRFADNIDYGRVTLTGKVLCSTDRRGYTDIATGTWHRTYFIIGYDRGDVDGNERIDVSDVSTLTDHLLGKQLDTYGMDAADVDCDGEVSINDVTTLINEIL